MKKQRLELLSKFFIIVLFIFTFNGASSRYIGQVDGKANDVNAVPILNLTNPDFDETITSMLPGDIKEADFYVENHDDSNTNEVLMKYYLKVQVDSEIPVNVYLTDENGTEVTLDGENKTEEKDFPYDTEMKTKYHIKIEWDAKNNDSKYAGKDLKLNIEVMATQIVEGG